MTARYARTEEVDGRQAYVLELENSRQKIVKYWFDTSNYELIKIIAPLPAREEPDEQEILFSDYREVSGTTFPFKLVPSTSSMSVEMAFDSIQVNTGLDDSVCVHQEN